MRRAFLICLMVLLPFQFSWSAVAATCMHEPLEGSSHWGHHEAEHVEVAPAEPETNHASLDAENRSGTVNVDHHHLPGVYPFPSLFLQPFIVGTASASPPELSVDFATATALGLERPPKVLAEFLRREGLGHV
ncbi:hypothetical protein DTW89_03575 [Acidovorax sp. BoFeN1]|jgi:hypothetical protein|uniref:hypothetical protein n=1 Tax=unclassified Acidovorax TaxID=2684926 RepID=UPI0004669C65|nr:MULTISPECIES: hypothetical protein [unclassified Acidovorax]RDD94861.1 hypothetical protein DTW89_03575 [Acidovorax sp. BoFeN1]